MNKYEMKEHLAVIGREFDKLQGEFEQFKKEALKWSWEDIAWFAKDHGYECSQEQAQEILEEMIRKHDASVGVNWDTIDYYVSEKCKLKQQK